MSAHWSLGVIVGLPILTALVAAAVLAGVTLIRRSSDMDDIDGPIAKWGGVALLGAAVIAVIVAASPAGYFPFGAEYHQWRPVQGEVTAVSSRIIGDGSHGVNQRFVLKVGDDQRLYGCDDTRCATVKVGDSVSLMCKREWQYASVSGYGCRWAS